MQSYPTTIVLRHRRENLKKCSLRGLEKRSDFAFYKYPNPILPDLSNYILLSLDAPALTIEDSNRGLFILDGTWRYAETMYHVHGQQAGIVYRSLPEHYRTAYPRKQEDCSDPERGLASIEAIYLSYMILGRDVSGLLEGYFWKDQFLEKNSLPTMK